MAKLRAFFAKAWRPLLLVVGAVAIAFVVRKVGAATVGRALVAAGPFLPVILVLEATWMGMDVFVLRALLGDRRGRAPWSAYARSAITAYAVNILFPAGRASAEATRAGLLSPYVGAANVATAAIAIQGSSLLGNSLITIAALATLVARFGTSSKLVLATAASALITGAGGVLFLLGSRTGPVQRFLRKRLPRFRDAEEAPNASSKPVLAVALSFSARAIQALLYTIAFLAVTGAFSPLSGLTAQSISLCGSTFGDAVPQQAGVIEGAFLVFAKELGLADRADLAVSIALVVRIAQLLLAASALLVSSLWRGTPTPVEAAPPAPAAR